MRKIGILCLVVVLALGAMGVGYATWSQTLTITETVNTGEFCIEYGMQTPTVGDDVEPPGGVVFPTNDPDENATRDFTRVYFPTPGKNVAWGTAVYTDYDASGECPQGLMVTLHDVYPWYYNHVDFWTHNCGTIPANLNKILVLDAPGGNLLQEITYDGQIVTLDLDGNGTMDFQMIWGDNIGDQFDPCIQKNFSFGILILQDEDPDWQDNTFTFYIELVFDQFNAP